VIKVVVVAVLLISAFKASAQDLVTRNLTDNGNYIWVPSGYVAEIIFASGGLRFFDQFTYVMSEPIYFSQSSKYPFYFTGADGNGIYGASSTPTTLTYRIISNVAVGSPTTNYIPASAVVIPADSNGSVRIILESSADLITWTEANPGLYGSSSSKRFFRVRAVNQ
jgi:hypothetical protein